jgi:hypothetical protein
LTELSTPENYPGFFTYFSAGLLQSRSIHRDQLPHEPRNWREMKNHPHQKGFLEAAHREIEELTQKKTFIHVERPQKTQILPGPLTWVFRYKFDTDGFLTKYKSLAYCAEFAHNLLEEQGLASHTTH